VNAPRLPWSVLLVVAITTGPGCKRRTPRSSADLPAPGAVDGGVEIVSFDEVTDKVWDELPSTSPGPSRLDSELIRRNLRRHFKPCLCPALPAMQGAPAGFHLRMTVAVDARGGFAVELGRFDGPQPPPESALVGELRKAEGCIERGLQTGIDWKGMAGRPFRITYPFLHGLPCTDSD
jgi:hypothetical protein